MPYGDLNIDRMVTSVPQGIVGAGNASLMKNRIINGAMVVDQRNAGASVTPANGVNTYTIDRWAGYANQTSKFTVQQNAGSITPPINFINYLGATSSSAYSIVSTDIFLLRQAIEGFNTADLNWGTANAQTITISFWVRSSVTGTFGGSINNNAGNRFYPFSYTINSANTWEQKAITIVGDTTGTWLTTNSVGIWLNFSLGTGSSYLQPAGTWTAGAAYGATGQTNILGTSGATFYITGVQLEVGSYATGYEYRHYGQELALCQRYYEQVTYDYGGAITTGQAINAGRALANLGWTVMKRTLPSVSMTGTINVWNANATGYLSTNVSFSDASVNNVRIDCNSVTGNPLTAGNAAMIYPDVTDAVLKVSAEL